MGRSFGSNNRGIRHFSLYRIPFSEVTAETDTDMLRSLEAGIHQVKRLPVQVSNLHFQITGYIIGLQYTIQMSLDIHCPVLHHQGSIDF